MNYFYESKLPEVICEIRLAYVYLYAILNHIYVCNYGNTKNNNIELQAILIQNFINYFQEKYHYI